MKKKKMSHPEHITWWDKNYKRLIIYSGLLSVLLLLLPLFVFDFLTSNAWIGISYIIILQISFIFFYLIFHRNEGNM